MNETIKRLGDGELDIMLAVWRAGEPVNSAWVQEALRGKRDWTLPALLTALSRLVEKGFLACEKQGRSNRYRPLISKEAYQAREGKTVLDRLYGGSFTALTAALYDGGAVTAEDLEDLRRFLAEQEAKLHE